MENWPTTRNIKQLMGFLGYYKRFIKEYAKIAAPMTNLLKMNAFLWSDSIEENFKALKAAMLKTPILAYPDFQKEFVVETNACNAEIGVVLSQENHFISYYSCKLTRRMKAPQCT